MSRSTPRPRTAPTTQTAVPTSTQPVSLLGDLGNLLSNPFGLGNAAQGNSPLSNAPPTSPLVGGFNAISGAINSTVDFFKAVAWLVYPRNWLRMVEFVTGMLLIGFGAWAAMQARGESREGFTTGESALSRSGLGRVSRALAINRRTGGGARVESAPHRSRRQALRQRYAREERVRQRERSGNRSNKSQKKGSK